MPTTAETYQSFQSLIQSTGKEELSQKITSFLGTLELQALQKLFIEANSFYEIELIADYLKKQGKDFPAASKLESLNVENAPLATNSTPEKVAIAGAGPVALIMALEQLRLGNKVEVFEQRPLENGIDARYQVLQYAPNISKYLQSGSQLDKAKEFKGFNNREALAVKEAQRRLLKMCHVLGGKNFKLQAGFQLNTANSHFEKVTYIPASSRGTGDKKFQVDAAGASIPTTNFDHFYNATGSADTGGVHSQAASNQLPIDGAAKRYRSYNVVQRSLLNKISEACGFTKQSKNQKGTYAIASIQLDVDPNNNAFYISIVGHELNKDSRAMYLACQAAIAMAKIRAQKSFEGKNIKDLDQDTNKVYFATILTAITNAGKRYDETHQQEQTDQKTLKALNHSLSSFRYENLLGKRLNDINGDPTRIGDASYPAHFLRGTGLTNGALSVAYSICNQLAQKYLPDAQVNTKEYDALRRDVWSYGSRPEDGALDYGQSKVKNKMQHALKSWHKQFYDAIKGKCDLAEKYGNAFGLMFILFNANDAIQILLATGAINQSMFGDHYEAVWQDILTKLEQLNPSLHAQITQPAAPAAESGVEHTTAPATKSAVQHTPAPAKPTAVTAVAAKHPPETHISPDKSRQHQVKTPKPKGNSKRVMRELNFILMSPDIKLATTPSITSLLKPSSAVGAVSPVKDQVAPPVEDHRIISLPTLSPESLQPALAGQQLHLGVAGIKIALPAKDAKPKPKDMIAPSPANPVMESITSSAVDHIIEKICSQAKQQEQSQGGLEDAQSFITTQLNDYRHIRLIPILSNNDAYIIQATQQNPITNTATQEYFHIDSLTWTFTKLDSDSMNTLYQKAIETCLQDEATKRGKAEAAAAKQAHILKQFGATPGKSWMRSTSSTDSRVSQGADESTDKQQEAFLEADVQGRRDLILAKLQTTAPTLAKTPSDFRQGIVDNQINTFLEANNYDYTLQYRHKKGSLGKSTNPCGVRIFDEIDSEGNQTDKAYVIFPEGDLAEKSAYVDADKANYAAYVMEYELDQCEGSLPKQLELITHRLQTLGESFPIHTQLIKTLNAYRSAHSQPAITATGLFSQYYDSKGNLYTIDLNAPGDKVQMTSAAELQEEEAQRQKEQEKATVQTQLKAFTDKNSIKDAKDYHKDFALLLTARHFQLIDDTSLTTYIEKYNQLYSRSGYHCEATSTIHGIEIHTLEDDTNSLLALVEANTNATPTQDIKASVHVILTRYQLDPATFNDKFTKYGISIDLKDTTSVISYAQCIKEINKNIDDATNNTYYQYAREIFGETLQLNPFSKQLEDSCPPELFKALVAKPATQLPSKKDKEKFETLLVELLHANDISKLEKAIANQNAIYFSKCPGGKYHYDPKAQEISVTNETGTNASKIFIEKGFNDLTHEEKLTLQSYLQASEKEINNGLAKQLTEKARKQFITSQLKAINDALAESHINIRLTYAPPAKSAQKHSPNTTMFEIKGTDLAIFIEDDGKSVLMADKSLFDYSKTIQPSRFAEFDTLEEQLILVHQTWQKKNGDQALKAQLIEELNDFLAHSSQDSDFRIFKAGKAANDYFDQDGARYRCEQQADDVRKIIETRKEEVDLESKLLALKNRETTTAEKTTALEDFAAINKALAEDFTLADFEPLDRINKFNEIYKQLGFVIQSSDVADVKTYVLHDRSEEVEDITGFLQVNARDIDSNDTTILDELKKKIASFKSIFSLDDAAFNNLFKSYGLILRPGDAIKTYSSAFNLLAPPADPAQLTVAETDALVSFNAEFGCEVYYNPFSNKFMDANPPADMADRDTYLAPPAPDEAKKQQHIDDLQTQLLALSNTSITVAELKNAIAKLNDEIKKTNAEYFSPTQTHPKFALSSDNLSITKDGQPCIQLLQRYENLSDEKKAETNTLLREMHAEIIADKRKDDRDSIVARYNQRFKAAGYNIHLRYRHSSKKINKQQRIYDISTWNADGQLVAADTPEAFFIDATTTGQDATITKADATLFNYTDPVQPYYFFTHKDNLDDQLILLATELSEITDDKQQKVLQRRLLATLNKVNLEHTKADGNHHPQMIANPKKHLIYRDATGTQYTITLGDQSTVDKIPANEQAKTARKAALTTDLTQLLARQNVNPDEPLVDLTQDTDIIREAIALDIDAAFVTKIVNHFNHIYSGYAKIEEDDHPKQVTLYERIAEKEAIAEYLAKHKADFDDSGKKASLHRTLIEKINAYKTLFALNPTQVNNDFAPYGVIIDPKDDAHLIFYPDLANELKGLMKLTPLNTTLIEQKCKEISDYFKVDVRYNPFSGQAAIYGAQKAPYAFIGFLDHSIETFTDAHKKGLLSAIKKDLVKLAKLEKDTSAYKKLLATITNTIESLNKMVFVDFAAGKYSINEDTLEILIDGENPITLASLLQLPKDYQQFFQQFNPAGETALLALMNQAIQEYKINHSIEKLEDIINTLNHLHPALEDSDGNDIKPNFQLDRTGTDVNYTTTFDTAAIQQTPLFTALAAKLSTNPSTYLDQLAAQGKAATPSDPDIRQAHKRFLEQLDAYVNSGEQTDKDTLQQSLTVFNRKRRENYGDADIYKLDTSLPIPRIIVDEPGKDAFFIETTKNLTQTTKQYSLLAAGKILPLQHQSLSAKKNNQAALIDTFGSVLAFFHDQHTEQSLRALLDKESSRTGHKSWEKTDAKDRVTLVKQYIQNKNKIFPSTELEDTFNLFHLGIQNLIHDRAQSSATDHQANVLRFFKTYGINEPNIINPEYLEDLNDYLTSLSNSIKLSSKELPLAVQFFAIKLLTSQQHIAEQQYARQNILVQKFEEHSNHVATYLNLTASTSAPSTSIIKQPKTLAQVTLNYREARKQLEAWTQEKRELTARLSLQAAARLRADPTNTTASEEEVELSTNIGQLDARITTLKKQTNTAAQFYFEQIEQGNHDKPKQSIQQQAAQQHISQIIDESKAKVEQDRMLAHTFKDFLDAVAKFNRRVDLKSDTKRVQKYADRIFKAADDYSRTWREFSGHQADDTNQNPPGLTDIIRFLQQAIDNAKLPWTASQRSGEEKRQALQNFEQALNVIRSVKPNDDPVNVVLDIVEHQQQLATARADDKAVKRQSKSYCEKIDQFAASAELVTDLEGFFFEEKSLDSVRKQQLALCCFADTNATAASSDGQPHRRARSLSNASTTSTMSSASQPPAARSRATSVDDAASRGRRPGTAAACALTSPALGASAPLADRTNSEGDTDSAGTRPRSASH